LDKVSCGDVTHTAYNPRASKDLFLRDAKEAFVADIRGDESIFTAWNIRVTSKLDGFDAACIIRPVIVFM